MNAFCAPEIFAFSCDFRTAKEVVLSRLAGAFSRERIAEFYAGKNFSEFFRECVVLSTCNRVEFYTAGTPEVFAAEKTGLLLEKFSGVPAEEISRNGRSFVGARAIAHLFEVASGLESRMVGEAEILGQVKQAYEAATAAGTTGAALNRVFQKSFHAAKWARSNTGIAHGQVSVGNVAVELAGRIFGELSRRSALVVGTGEAGRKTAQAFISRGAGCVMVASRDFARARSFASEIGAAPIETDAVPAHAVSSDIVIGCAAVSEPVISEKTLREILRSRKGRPLFLLDLGLPKNFPQGVFSDDLWLYDLEDLAKIANENLSAREREAASCRAELARRAERVLDSLSRG